MSIQSQVESLGGLHDSRLIAIDWSAEERRLRLVVDDLHANTWGYPGYPGPTRATVTFSEISRLDVAADLTLEGLSIFEWSLSLEAQGLFSSVIGLAPGGRVSIVCRSIEIDGIEPAAA
jgi:hypothetical protein